MTSGGLILYLEKFGLILNSNFLQKIFILFYYLFGLNISAKTHQVIDHRTWCVSAQIEQTLKNHHKTVMFDRFSWCYEVFRSLFDLGWILAQKHIDPCALTVPLTPLGARPYRFEYCPIRLCVYMVIPMQGYFGSTVLFENVSMQGLLLNQMDRNLSTQTKFESSNLGRAE